LQAAGKHLQTLPDQIGNWRLAKDSKIAPNVLQILQCSGYINRTYTHQETGQSVDVALIAGPPGPTAVHTPEICFSSRAYDLDSGPGEVALPGTSARLDSFWSMTFKPKRVGADQLQVYYGWSLGDRWVASSSPRFEFGGRPLLFKIQLAALHDGQPGADATDPCRDFLTSLSHSGWSLAGKHQ
jgi:hypothetical protein